MRTRSWLLLVALTATLAVGACSQSPSPGRAPRPSRTPALGGAAPASHAPPSGPMDGLERQVAARLAHQVASQGLDLSYLHCPRWDRRVPRRMTCRAYVDGLLVPVRVHLRAEVAGKAVGFDASLAHGLIATRRLEQTLRGRGWSTADCGGVRAYPATVGSRIVCHVARHGEDRWVVARVEDRAGRVMISDYRDPGGTPSP